jgi:hypothetical protein
VYHFPEWFTPKAWDGDTISTGIPTPYGDEIPMPLILSD